MDHDIAKLPDFIRDLFQSDLGAMRTSSGSELTKLGSDGGGTFVVDQVGAVVWLAANPELASRFVNSSRSLFGEFLSMVGSMRDGLAGTTDRDAIRTISEMRDLLRGKDPAAFRSDDSWWSVVFEQMDDGLL